MVFPILPANTLSGDYDVSNSVRFRPAGNSQMSQGNGTQTNSKKWTISFWVKIAFDTISSGQRCVYSSTGASSNGSFVQFSDTAMKVGCQGVSETDWVRFLGTTTIQFRDPSAWYHFCFGFDSTQGTDTNRIRSYVNGTEVGYLASEGNYPTQNDDSNFNNGSDCALGKNITTNDSYLDGYVSQFYFIDGTQYAASDFGETDEDSGIWKPKAFSGTFGNNGTFVEGDSNTADASGNGNNFGQSNTVITTDTPTNNFCTLNSVDNDGVVLTEGNLTFDSSSGNNEGVRGTMGVQNGKWYYECTITGSAGMAAGNLGYSRPEVPVTSGPASVLGLFANGSSTFGLYNNSSGKTSLDASDGIDQNDVIGVALDLDNDTIAYYRESSIMGSAQSINASILGDFLLPVMLDDGGANDVAGHFNFGNPTVTLDSGNADENGYGNFEHAPPSGFYALCTKNLAKYG